jgi:RNA-directed DNA polymerase
MLYLRQVRHLAQTLGISAEELKETLSNPQDYFDTLIVRDPAKPDRPRTVICVTGPLRVLQLRFYRRVLLRKLVPSPYSHGGIRGRDIKTNAGAHRASAFVFKTDIAHFFPDIHSSRVYRLFSDNLRCSPDVARLCTRLCTCDHHLALGLITSPILADLTLRRADMRIGAACAKAGLTYTRYVDDITISGAFNLEGSGVPDVVAQILSDDGFRINSKKNKFGSLSKRFAITNIRVIGERFDVRKEYAEELQRQLDDARRLSLGERFDGR